MSAKAAVGHLVHYFTTKTEKRQPYPAVITHVHEDGAVNLHVFNDPEFFLHGEKMMHRVPRRTADLQPSCWAYPAEPVPKPTPAPVPPVPAKGGPAPKTKETP